MNDMKALARRIALIGVLALVVAACGAGSSGSADGATSDPLGATTVADDHSEDGEDHAEDDADHQDGADDHDVAFTFGSPGDPAGADRVIEVEARDDLTFSPSEISVAEGETITFVVTNTGSVAHDFTLGDQATQDAHAEEMAEMMASGNMGDHDDPNAVVLDGGETKELTWTFGEAGEMWFGCHQPGHYAAGMVGLAMVTG